MKIKDIQDHYITPEMRVQANAIIARLTAGKGSGQFNTIVNGMLGRAAAGNKSLTAFGSLQATLQTLFGKRSWGVNASNPSVLLNLIQDQVGATLLTKFEEGSIAIAAVNTMRVENASGMDTNIVSLFTTTTQPMFIRYSFDYTLTSDSPFGVCFFVALMENGETITACDYNGDYLRTAIQGSQAAQDYVLFQGPITRSRIVKDAGNKWVAQASMNLAELANMYALHYHSQHLNELSERQLKLGVAVYGKAGQSVAFVRHQCQQFVLQTREMV